MQGPTGPKLSSREKRVTGPDAKMTKSKRSHEDSIAGLLRGCWLLAHLRSRPIMAQTSKGRSLTVLTAQPLLRVEGWLIQHQKCQRSEAPAECNNRNNSNNSGVRVWSVVSPYGQASKAKNHKPLSCSSIASISTNIPQQNLLLHHHQGIAERTRARHLRIQEQGSTRSFVAFRVLRVLRVLRVWSSAKLRPFDCLKTGHTQRLSKLQSDDQALLVLICFACCDLVMPKNQPVKI